MLLELSGITPSNDFSRSGNQRCLFLPTDGNGRAIWLTRLEQVRFAGAAAFYPAVQLHSGADGRFYNPIMERTMSLAGAEAATTPRLLHDIRRQHAGPVFYFIYNTDNYFHFIYDTLPYLISYQELRQRVPGLRLLMNLANSQSQDFYRFVLEFLELFEIRRDELVLADMQTEYAQVYLSDSYTHGHDSNAAPRAEIYEQYRQLAGRHSGEGSSATAPRRIYVSRRSWLHGDYSNIGTNYTTRRRLENEDALMELLAGHGFAEVFTENLTTPQKLELFGNAEVVVGALGGGVCNVLFSPPQTRLLCLASPTFLDVNARFVHSLNQVRLTWFDRTSHVENGRFKRFMRISCPDRGIVGEITDIQGETLSVAYTREKVSGWNAQNSFETTQLPMAECQPLDAGLNSAWRIDMAAFEAALHSVL